MRFDYYVEKIYIFFDRDLLRKIVIYDTFGAYVAANLKMVFRRSVYKFDAKKYSYLEQVAHF